MPRPGVPRWPAGGSCGLVLGGGGKRGALLVWRGFGGGKDVLIPVNSMMWPDLTLLMLGKTAFMMLMGPKKLLAN